MLGRLNPLLASVLTVQGQHAVQLSAMPDGGSWPAAGVSVRVEAMQARWALVLGGGACLRWLKYWHHCPLLPAYTFCRL